MASVTDVQTPVSQKELFSQKDLISRATAYHKELLAAKVKLTTPPLSRLQLVSITPLATKGDRITSAKLVYETTVEPSDCNTWGTIHGGCVFTLCNAVGKIATAVVVKGARKIVSTDLTTNYLAGISVGAKVLLEVECLRTTKSLGFLRGVVRDQKGTVCYIWVQNVGFEI
ncbi:hypothetical protein J3B02_004967 [Coemansia erecta]|nr:hypothetical protein J3B02_004967 [Coemansia erecta]KAJ2865247.1 hypothetical protein FB639_005129 [Coemansia asiatica]